MSSGDLAPWEVPISQGDSIVRCTCSCGCSNDSGLPTALRGTRIASQVRCPSCRATHAVTPPVADPRDDIDVTDDDAWNARIAADEEDRKWSDAQQRWRERVPQRFRDATTAHPKVVPVLERWKRTPPAPGRGLLVLGGVGGGKTTMGFGLLNALVQQRLVFPETIEFGTESNLLEAIARAPFDQQETMKRRLFSPRWKIVMVDDVGRASFHRRTDQHALWHELLDTLWRNDRSVVVTTNFTGEELRDWIGEPAADRLSALIPGEAVRLNAQNYRRLTEGVQEIRQNS